MLLSRALIFAVLLTAALSQAAAQESNSCARCHQKIVESYRKTAMANASGPAEEGLIPGAFTHAASGVHYELALRDGKAWLRYERPGDTLKGEQQLSYFLGSGTRGRTYLFGREGYWFEIPVNWYAKKAVWDMAPNYLQTREMPFTLPVDPGCLHCHASGVAASLPQARNRFAGRPFAQSGIGCSACHGDATQHLAAGGRSPILNPDKLDPVRRDSACLNCHLEGQSAIARQGHSIGEYRPGDNLFEQVAYFVRASEGAGVTRATSQWEALLASRCKRASGDRLTCTTCHDPHSSPTPEQRVAFYRAKCLTCHNTPEIAGSHHPEQPDCASCHMPRRNTEDIAHEQLTDHRIQRAAGLDRKGLTTTQASTTAQDLVPVGGSTGSSRDLGLAYAQFAERGDRNAGERALALLTQAEKTESRPATDAPLHTALGFLRQVSGDLSAAREEYARALAADPYQDVAAGNLAVMYAGEGDFPAAERLLRKVVANDPAQIPAALNLAAIQCRTGQAAAAQATLARILQFSPDERKARAFASAIATGTACSAQSKPSSTATPGALPR